METVVGWTLITFQQHARCNLQIQGCEGLAGLNFMVGCQADHNTWRAKTTLSQSRTNVIAVLLLRSYELFKPVGLRFNHRIAESSEHIGWHSGIIRMTAVYIGLHDRQPPA